MAIIEGLEESLRKDLKRDPEVSEKFGRVWGTIAEVFRTKANKELQKGGNVHGYNVGPVIQSSEAGPVESTGTQPIGQELRVEVSWPHPAAGYFDKGTEPHHIEPKNAHVLAFEWEGAPEEIRTMFQETFPTVFFSSVDVEGIVAIRYIAKARAFVEEHIAQHDAEFFEQ